VRAEPNPARGHRTDLSTIVILLYLQLLLEFTLESSSTRGVYRNRAGCEAAALQLRGPLAARLAQCRVQRPPVGQGIPPAEWPSAGPRPPTLPLR
jgi:hypothetical protein